MDSGTATAAISAASGLLGALIGASATYLAHRQERRGRERDELTNAIVATNRALSALTMEIRQLPRTTRITSAADTVLNSERTPNLFFLLSWLSFKTLSRDAKQALLSFADAAHRLELIGPPEVLGALEGVTALLSRVDERDERWFTQLEQARARLTVAGRSQVGTGNVRMREAAIG